MQVKVNMLLPNWPKIEGRLGYLYICAKALYEQPLNPPKRLKLSVRDVTFYYGHVTPHLRIQEAETGR